MLSEREAVALDAELSSLMSQMMGGSSLFEAWVEGQSDVEKQLADSAQVYEVVLVELCLV